jgi:hypothetical protein
LKSGSLIFEWCLSLANLRVSLILDGDLLLMTFISAKGRLEVRAVSQRLARPGFGVESVSVYLV